NLEIQRDLVPLLRPLQAKFVAEVVVVEGVSQEEVHALTGQAPRPGSSRQEALEGFGLLVQGFAESYIIGRNELLQVNRAQEPPSPFGHALRALVSDRGWANRDLSDPPAHLLD